MKFIIPKIVAGLLLLHCLGCGQKQDSNGQTAVRQEQSAETTREPEAQPGGDKVIAVKDGDTFELLRGKETITVRLYGVDAPEKKQDYGERAKQFASELAFGKFVQLIPHNKDRYGRTVGTIILPDGRSLNEELVKEGYAWHYKAYSKDVKLANLETDARRYKRGLWAGAAPIAPWDFRKGKRSGSPLPEPEPGQAGNVASSGKKTGKTVYLCNSKGSDVYHTRKDCPGLDRCKSDIVETGQQEAEEQYKRRPAKDCAVK